MLFERLCVAPPPVRAPQPAQQPAAQQPAQPQGPPPRGQWYAEPVKVFDNLYFVGQTEYTAWAVVTSGGILVIDPLFDYSVEEEVAKGLTTLGLDPKQIRYVLVSHAHSDHVAALWGGTGFNWQSGSPRYITPERPPRFWYDSYSSSARRFRDIAVKAGADVLLSNHPADDGSGVNLPAMAKRRTGQPHPYVIGKENVSRFLTVAEECAKAGPLW